MKTNDVIFIQHCPRWMAASPNSQQNFEATWYVLQETIINHFLFKCVTWTMFMLKFLSLINNDFFSNLWSTLGGLAIMCKRFSQTWLKVKEGSKTIKCTCISISNLHSREGGPSKKIISLSRLKLKKIWWRIKTYSLNEVISILIF
jgi:hypothetical protein